MARPVPRSAFARFQNAQQQADIPAFNPGAGGTGSSGYSPQNPIGVPYWEIDPKTGMPKGATQDSSGKWIIDPSTARRWTAPGRPGTPNTMSGTNGPPGGVGTGGQLVHGTAGSGPVLPRYYDGDEMKPAQMHPAEITALQKGMQAAGILPAKGVVYGRWDPQSASAFKDLLASSNASGMDAFGQLKQWIVATKKNPPQTGLPIHLTAKEDLQSTFRKAYMDMTGAGASQPEIDRMVNAYQMTQAQAQQQAQLAAKGDPQAMANADALAQQTAASGASYEKAPSAGAFIENEIRTQHPTQVAEQKLTGQGGVMDTLDHFLGQWSDRGLHTP